MRLIYMGTPQFAVAPLRALANAGYDIAGVVTRTDKPAGRGREVAAPAVKLFAMERGLPLFQPKRIRDPEVIETLAKLAPDVIVVAAYGQILPQTVLSLPKLGCINIHASLLPSYRGAAPINWAIIRGDREAGITIMQMDAGMDTGAMLMQESVPIEAADTAGSLAEKLSDLGAAMITRALPKVADGSLKPVPQDNARATMAPLLKKEDGLIDWTLPAAEIRNRVRGLSPWPGAYTFLDKLLVKILQVEVSPGSAAPGVISAPQGKDLQVGTGRDLIRILMVQPAGKKAMSATAFLQGHRGIEGKRFKNL